MDRKQTTLQRIRTYSMYCMLTNMACSFDPLFLVSVLFRSSSWKSLRIGQQVQKYGGTSVGKFIQDIASAIVPYVFSRCYRTRAKSTRWSIFA